MGRWRPSLANPRRGVAGSPAAVDGQLARCLTASGSAECNPAAGYYRVWIQAERDDTILTVPCLLHVTGAPEEAP